MTEINTLLRDTLVYIPTYNAEKTIREALRLVARHAYGASILVVDDGSTDDTGLEAAQGFKQFLPSTDGPTMVGYIRHPVNRGYGGAQKTAIDYAIAYDYTYAVMLHGDCQYPAHHILDLLQLLDGGADYAYGSRMLGDPLAGGMPRIRYALNRISNPLQNLASGLKLSEWHSGFRAYRVEALKKIPYQRLTNGFTFDTEITYQLAQIDAVPGETAIPTAYHDEGISYVPSRYPFDIAATTIRYLLHRLRIRKDEKWID